MGSLVKRVLAKRLGRSPSDFVHVSIEPCLDRRNEADRAEFRFDDKNKLIDFVLTTEVSPSYSCPWSVLGPELLFSGIPSGIEDFEL